MQQRNKDFIVIAAKKIALCVLIKNYLIPKNITNKIGKRQHYLKVNRLKEKLYVSKTNRLRGLIIEIYNLPSPNGCVCSSLVAR